MKAVALALHLDDLGVGEEAVEDGGGRGDIAEESPQSWVGRLVVIRVEAVS